MKNQITTQEFSVRKMYEGFPSKTSIQFTGTLEECKRELAMHHFVAKRNGADIVSESEMEFTCADYGSMGETVTYDIN